MLPRNRAKNAAAAISLTHWNITINSDRTFSDEVRVIRDESRSETDFGLRGSLPGSVGIAKTAWLLRFSALRPAIILFRSREVAERGDYASINELAAAEKISPTYLGRVLRLTLLAPEIIEAILAGKQPARLTMVELMEALPVVWAEQRPMLTG
ncbi:MAG: hypothetical protein ACOH12_10080 [Parvibaculaceae bacterium]